MATLTNTKIKDTYDGLLKTTDNDVIGITEKVITDGLGNASILSIGTQSASFSNNVVITGSLTASGLSYPTSDGTAGQAIVTDAAGNLSFATVTSPTPTLQQVTTAGATTTDSITVGGLTAASLIYPSTDGTSGQVISTDGAGNLTFTTVSTSTPSLDQVTAVGATSSINIIINGADLGTIVSSSNTLFGDSALSSFTTGSFNTAIGYQALTAATGGSGNTVVGARALDNYTSGTTNTAIGSEALGNGTTLSYNVAVGDDALFYINGSYNVALGHNAGEIRTGGGTKSAGDSNIYIGSNTVSAAADTDNEIVIGANATGNGSNSATYGDSNITKHIFTGGNVGIGMTPNEKLSIKNAINTPAIEIVPSTDNNNADTAVLRLWGTAFGTANRYSEIRNVTDGSTANNELAFNTNGSEKMRIDSSGNVTINAGNLFLANNEYYYSKTTGGSNVRMLGINSGNVAYIGAIEAGVVSTIFNASSTSATASFYTSGSEKMRIDSSGNVGIGESNPQTGMHISLDTPIIRLENIDTSLIIDQELAGIEMYSNDASGLGVGIKTSIRAVSESNTGSKFGLKFSTTDSTGSSDVERMRIDSSGNIIYNLPSIGGTRDIQFPQFAASNAKTIIRATGTSDYRQHLDILMNTAQADVAPTTVVRIDNSGNVGINTQSADDLMHIEDNDSTVSATQLTLEGRYGGYGAGINFVSRTSSGGTRVSMAKITADGESSWNTTASTQDAGLRFFTTNGGSQSERMRITSSGAVFMPYLTGSSGYNDLAYNTANGQLIYRTSSLRYKENVQDLPSALDKVNNLRTVTYDEKETGRSYFGLIAEELYEHIPELVTMKEIEGFDEPQPDGITYSMLSVYLLKAMQEQQEIINDLKARIETLEAK